MPSLTTEIFVKCPKDSKRVDVKQACVGPPRCEFAGHFTVEADRIRRICKFGEEPRREECVLQDLPDPELDQMEEESLENESTG